MSWESHAQKTARVPCTVVEIDLDWYADVAIAATNDDGSLCYRTPETTDQAAVPAPTLTVKTRRFMSKMQRGIPEISAAPCLVAAKIQGDEIRIGRGIGYFGEATITLVDFIDDDVREDPFYTDSSRTGRDRKAGSYFSKLLARNPFWTSRPIRIIEGWTTDGVWHAGDAITHNFLVRDIQGPSAGTITITAVGPLQLLNLNDAEAPKASSGLLISDITAAATSLTLSPAGIGAAEYPSGANHYARIGDEVVKYSRSGDVLTLTRGQMNTVAATHQAGDTVQVCANYTSTKLTDILIDVLTTYGGVSSSLLDLTGWAAEQLNWLSAYVLNGIISKPTSVLDIVQELLDTAGAMIWWDDQSGLLKFRAIRPSASSLATLTDQFSLMGTGLAINRDMSERISRTDMLISIRDPSQDPKDDRSYRIRVVGAPVGEGQTAHRSSQVNLTYSRWLDASTIALAERATEQATAILSNGRIYFTATIPAKDAWLNIGDIVNVVTRDIVDRNGTPQLTRVIVSRRDPAQYGSQYNYTFDRVPFDGRFAFYVDHTYPSYDAATSDQRDPGAYYADAAGHDFGPSDAAYLYG